MLASQLAQKYRYENCAVVAIDDGGVMVGSQIAVELHCVLTMLLADQISLPRENIAVGGITQDGVFSYNSEFSTGEIEELTSEYHGFIEQDKLEKLHKMHELLGSGGLIDANLLRGNNIILVTEGLESGFRLDLAAAFLKTIRYEKLIVATPLASVSAVDRMHIVADEIYCLSVVENYLSTDHYYDKQDVPSHEKVVETIEKIVLNWK